MAQKNTQDNARKVTIEQWMMSPQGGITQQLQQILANSVGPGATMPLMERVQLWDIYSTRPFYNDSNIAGGNWELFNFTQGSQISGPGFVAGTSPLYTTSYADTNLKAAGNLPFDMFIHGFSFDIINRQQTPGTVGGANDMAFYPTMKGAYLTDTYVAVNINDMDLDQLPVIEAPAGAGAWLSGAMGTTAALTVGASMQSTINGWPSASNYRNYANEGPFFCPSGSTIALKGQFGNSLLSASTVYKPANSGAATLFLKGVLRGFRIWWAI